MIFDSSGTRLQGNYLDIIYNNTTWTGDSRGMTSVASGDKRREKITIKWLQAIQDVIDDGGYVAMSIQTNNIILDDESSYLDMYAPKVEIGNKATDWTPAPEDIDTAISKTVKQVDVEYYLSNKSDSCEGGSWSTTAPTWVDGKFMWSRQKITYVDETIAIRNATCIAGAKGEKGESGIDAMDGYPSNPPLARWTFDNILKNKNNINYYPENNNKYNFESIVGSIVTNNGNAIFKGTQVVRAISDIDFNSDISISFWINISEASTQTILQNRNVVGYGFSIFLLNNKLRIDIGGTQNQFNEAFNINTNYHIIFTVNFTNKEINLYVNGIKKETKKPNISTSTNFTNYLWIGKSSADGINFNGNVLCGTLDDLRIYNYVLSQDNIEYLYRTKGQEAANGLIGTSIDSITEEFYLSTSRVTQTGGSWLTTPPSWESGKYIWTRSKIIYNNPSSIVYTEPLCSSEWEAINDLEIGGRNLLLKTNQGATKWSVSCNGGTITKTEDVENSIRGVKFTCTQAFTSWWFFSYSISDIYYKILSQKIYTISLEYKTNQSGAFSICIQNQNTSNAKHTLKTITLNGDENWHKDYITFKTNDVDLVSQILYMGNNTIMKTVDAYICIRNLKLEIGNKSTDWTPAPEDIDIDVGGRNYVKNTTNEWSDWWIIESTDTPVINRTNTITTLDLNDLNLSADEYLSLQIEIETTNFVAVADKTTTLITQGAVNSKWSGNDGYFPNPWGDLINISGVDKFNKISKFIKNYKIPASTIEAIQQYGGIIQLGFRCDYASKNAKLRWRCIKIEKGNKATDWTPAPEDIDENIETVSAYAQNVANELLTAKGQLTAATTRIDSLQGIIENFVKDDNGMVTVTQTGSGMQIDMTQATNRINQLLTAIESAVTEGEANQLRSELLAAIQAVQSRTAYINATQDAQGRPVITLGATDSPFKVEITNEAINFIQNGQIIAYANGQKFYNLRTVVQQDVQIGIGPGFIWKTRDSGNMGLTWVPAQS